MRSCPPMKFCWISQRSTEIMQWLERKIRQSILHWHSGEKQIKLWKAHNTQSRVLMHFLENQNEVIKGHPWERSQRFFQVRHRHHGHSTVIRIGSRSWSKGKHDLKHNTFELGAQDCWIQAHLEQGQQKPRGVKTECGLWGQSFSTIRVVYLPKYTWGISC
jgi:hypothetical protein